MAELVVSKQNIKSLLSLSDNGYTDKTYVIPEYQRPYRWGIEECDTLWTDIINFFTEMNDPGAAQEYFLGTVVTCVEEIDKNKIDIIDGQQRITSLLLLLRAFYSKLENSLKSIPDDDNVKGLMIKINPCIWRIDEMSGKVKDKTDLKIASTVALDEDNEDFRKILSSGEPLDTKSNYNTNYKFFLKKIGEFAAEMHPWKELCLCVLNRCIVLPIECNELNRALTIFSTLNNRGLELSDSDIFKAELYKTRTTQKEKSDFSEDWKNLEITAKEGNFSVNDIFRYYTHVIRARKGITDKEIGLRRFYEGTDKYQRYNYFKEKDFFDNIKDLAEFWNKINLNAETYDKDNGYCTIEATKYMQCLIAYPNDYWRCLVTVYYFKNRGKENFKEQFESFLRRLLAYLDVLFIMKPMVNEVKVPIFKFCVEVENTGDAIFKYEIPEDLDKRMDNASQGISRIVRPLILLNAYLYDSKQPIIPTNKVEIEHILPKKWKTANYNGWNRSEAELMLESIGNKIPFEKRLNIQAGNGYFGEKKEKYKSSVINEVRSLCEHSSNDWLKQDIVERRDEVCKRLIAFFNDNLNPVIAPDSQEEILSVKKGVEIVTITKLSLNGVISYRLNQTKQVDANKLTLQQIFSGAIPTNQFSKDFDNLKGAIQAIDKTILIGADSVEANDEVKNALYVAN